MQTQQKTYYFMAGLPRSGSTMLSAILNQNPRFHSGPSSPVMGIMLMIENTLLHDELFLAYPKNQQAAELVANVIQHYYSDVVQPVIIDKNRSWPSRMHYISGYFGITPKVICPVRNIDEILASFIDLHRRNPYQVNGKINFIDEMLIKANIPLSDENRCKFMMSDAGILGQSYQGIKQALLEGRDRQLHFVEYQDLTTDPRETMKKIYEFLEEPWFEHDFTHVVNIHKENDSQVYGFADMHDVRPQVSKSKILPAQVLPNEVYLACQGLEFWRDISPSSVNNLTPVVDAGDPLPPINHDTFSPNLIGA